jgi:hypothetical protein
VIAVYIVGCVLLGIASFRIGWMATMALGRRGSNSDPYPWLLVFIVGLVLVFV